MLAVTLVAMLFAPQAPQASIPFKPNPEDMVHIDGGKEPWRIPQWDVWALAFRIIAGGSKLLPSDVLDHVTAEEAALILKEAETGRKSEVACQQRMLTLRSRLLEDLAACEQKVESRCFQQKANAIQDERREIEIGCRWETLHARDRILESLEANPAGRAALAQWVESNKAGRTVILHKSEVEHFRRPE